MNVSNYKDNNFQEMLESFKHLNEKFHGEMRSGYFVYDMHSTHVHVYNDVYSSIRYYYTFIAVLLYLHSR